MIFQTQGTMDTEPIERAVFQAGDLTKNHPPQWQHPNKSVVFEIASSPSVPFEGQVVYARWAEEKPPAVIPAQRLFSIRPGVYEYAAPQEPTTVAWQVNFADPELFGYYGSSLLAQDELQVAEHPILASVREALVASGKPPRTVDERLKPTPVTVSNVQRRCVIDTQPNPATGCPNGLYGNAFRGASEEQIRAATTPLMPPTISNILAMAAPSYGCGEYNNEEIAYILNTAFTGFSAARRESLCLAGAASRTEIHTGFWGCGAFGGNRTLMTLLQALAGDLADVDIAFWAFDQPGLQVAEDAYHLYADLRETTPSVPQVIEEVVRRKFRWGLSDGN